MKFRFPKLKWRLQFSLLTLFGVMTAVAVGFGIAPTIRVQLAVRALSNRDIEVQTGFIPLRLEINTPAAKQLKHFGPQANSALQRALTDPEKFAAAHVLLSSINQRRIPSTHRHWNEMRVSVSDRADFHAEQIPRLQEFWRNRLGKHRSADVESETPIAVAPSP